MKTHNTLLLTLLCAIAFPSLHAQTSAETNNAVSQIRKTYSEINNATGYRLVTIDDAEEFLGHATDNGATLKGFYVGDSLKKIEEWIGLSNRVIQREYYFHGTEAVFIYTKECKYHFNDSTGELDYSKLEKTVSGRYYYTGGKLIRTILDDEEKEKTKMEDAADFLITCSHYRELLDKQKK